ncbi:MAG: hypothetical protein QM619_01715 [Micropruina sp.]|uniref:hypothetical protein n=1 Tax=Micropruina sp. TaxID=2737536 RepID=UPI0039E4AAEA
MKKIISTASSLAVALGGFVVASAVNASPAHAACHYTTAYTDTSPSWSETFKIGNGNTCQDLNAKYTLVVTDKIRGWYKQDGTWKKGTRGFERVPSSSEYTGGQTVLLSDVQDGVTVRGEGYEWSQDVRYMH